MKTYEMIYILDTAVADEAKEAFGKKLEDVITSNGGTVVSVDKWGVKKLAYPINYKNDGDYVLLTSKQTALSLKSLTELQA